MKTVRRTFSLILVSSLVAMILLGVFSGQGVMALTNSQIQELAIGGEGVAIEAMPKLFTADEPPKVEPPGSEEAIPPLEPIPFQDPVPKVMPPDTGIPSGLVYVGERPEAVPESSVTIYATDSDWHTGRVYEDLTCWDGYLRVRDDNVNGRGEVGGWARFNTSVIPDSSDITDVRLYFYVYEFDGIGPYVDFNEVENDPVYVSCSQTWTDITNGTTYIDNGYISTTGWWYIDVGSAGDIDLENLLSQDWYSVGFDHDDTASYWAHIRGHDDTNRPYIVVTYDVGQCDLEATNIDSDPSSPDDNDSIDLIGTVTNIGDGSCGSHQNTIYLQGIEQCNWTTSLSPGQSSVHTCGIGTLASGDYFISVEADTNGAVAESNESNNNRNEIMTVVPSGEPDIRVDPPSLSFNRYGGDISSSLQTVEVPEDIRRTNHERVYELLEENDWVQVIVHLHDLIPLNTSNEQRAIDVHQLQNNVLQHLSDEDFSSLSRFILTPGFAAKISKSGMDKLVLLPEVDMVYEDLPVKADLTQSVPLINADDVHNLLGYTGDGVTVAVLDTGIDTDHTDLSDDLVAEQCFTQGACPPGNTNQGTSAEDGDGHGTSVSGIITSRGTVAPLGVAPDAGIAAVKVLDDTGYGILSDWVLGIDWVTANHSTFDISVINMSIGSNSLYTGICDGSQPDSATAVNNAVANGITVFAASGNNGSGTQMSAPACLTNVISVGAVYDDNVGTSPNWCLNDSCTQTCQDSSTSADMVTCFSNSNSLLDIMAPSYRNRTTGLGGGTDSGFGGTSAASPHAAATGALMMQADSGLNPAAIETRLKDTGVSVTDPKNALSFPRIDAYAAILEGGFTIFNDGNANLSVSNIYVQNSSCWLSVAPTQSPPFTVSPGGSSAVGVTIDTSCLGSSYGSYQDSIRIRSDDPDEDPKDVPVSLNFSEQPRPDLVVTNPVPSVSPPFYVNQSVEWSVTTRNQGSGSAVATYTGYYLGTSCSDLSNRVNQDSVDPLDPGASEEDSDTYQFQPGEEGTWYKIAKADYDNDEPNESNENNNTNCYGPFEVRPQAGITIDPILGLVTTESGGTDTFTARLESQPTADVTISFNSSDTSEGTVSPASMTFSTSNWNIPQTATVSGLDDAVVDGDIPYNIISNPATSADSNFNGLDPADVSVTNLDNDDQVATIDGRVVLQGRSDHSGAVVEAWSGGSLADSTTTDASGYYALQVPAGTYEIRIEMERYLDAEKSGVSGVAGTATTLCDVQLAGGDSNDDDTINIQDIAFMGGRYLCSVGQACWDPKADINNDGIINIQDIVLAGGNYLDTSPVSWVCPTSS